MLENPCFTFFRSTTWDERFFLPRNSKLKQLLYFCLCFGGQTHEEDGIRERVQQSELFHHYIQYIKVRWNKQMWRQFDDVVNTVREPKHYKVQHNS